MRIFILSLLLLLLAAGSSFAQNGFFEPGLIVQQQDTIAGFIERNTEADLGRSIKFKIAPDAEELLIYEPADINGFSFSLDSTWFEPIEVEVLQDTVMTRHTRFAKVLLKGHTSLYKLQLHHHEYDPNLLLRNNKHVYILKMDGSYYTLAQHEFTKGNAVGVTKRYIGALSYLFRDCHDVLKEISSLDFEDKAIIESVRQYNQCAGSRTGTEFYTYKIKPVIRHGIEITYSRPFFQGQMLPVAGHAIGYFIDAYKPELSKRISARLGVGYSYFRSSSAGHTSENESTAHAVRIPMLLQVNIGPGHAAILPFIHAGITSFLYKTQNYSGLQNELAVGAGVYIRKIEIAFLLENVGFLKSSSTTLNFTLGLRLDNNKGR